MPRASRDITPIFKSAFQGPEDEHNTNLGVRPVVFDILAPDQSTSILPDNLKMVLHVNPTSLNFSYTKAVERIQTKGGYVEQHWGDAERTISFSMVTGGFKRLFTGMSNITGGGDIDTGGTRRETIAYDKYLDMLALFHNNGAIYDTRGQIAFHGILKMTFDGGVYLGWFTSFSVDESAEKPYQFDLSADFTIAHEVLRLRAFLTAQDQYVQQGAQRESSTTAVLPTQGAPPTSATPPSTIAGLADTQKPTDPTLSKPLVSNTGNASVTATLQDVVTNPHQLDFAHSDGLLDDTGSLPELQVSSGPDSDGDNLIQDIKQTSPAWWEPAPPATGTSGLDFAFGDGLLDDDVAPETSGNSGSTFALDSDSDGLLDDDVAPESSGPDFAFGDGLLDEIETEAERRARLGEQA